MLPVSIDAHGRLTNENDAGVRGAHLAKSAKVGQPVVPSCTKNQTRASPHFQTVFLSVGAWRGG